MRGEDINNMKPIIVNFFMSHVNGYTFRVQPNRKFAGLPAGASEILRITGGGWSVSRSEVCCILQGVTEKYSLYLMFCCCYLGIRSRTFVAFLQGVTEKYSVF